ncbi:MAG: InlB B-repeat-containing protein [Kiritimatiellae bacterium]|nr:InlB B-repeat-containing protein [Kiritimatiellia bacterium]
MKRFLPFLLPVLLAVSALAADISPSQAARAAEAWISRGFAEGVLPAGRTVSAVETLVDAASGARVLVAKINGGGFVVLSSDDRIEPVLAFSSEGKGPSADPRNPFWTLLRGDIAFREAAAGVTRGKKNAGKTGRAAAEATAPQRKWAALLAAAAKDKASKTKSVALWDIRVEPMVAARWNQETASAALDSSDWCYNYYTPNHYPCGCVATAIGQLMQYYRHPAKAVKAATYTCTVDGKDKAMKMKGGTYDWGKMPAKPWKKASLAQRKAIGKLLYDVGVTVQMDWSEAGSGAITLDGATALVRDFGYANAASHLYGTGLMGWGLPHFKKQVIPSLEAGSPVVLSIGEEAGGSGHAVLADGYGYSETDFFLHVNFGWGAKDDTCTAWYAPPDLAAGGYGFDTIRGFVYNVFPAKKGDVFSGRVVDRFDKPLPGIKVTLSDGQTATTGTNGIYAFVARRSADNTVNFTATAVKDGVKASCPTNMLFAGNSPANNIVLSFVTLRLDANGGSGVPATRAVPYAQAAGKLPVPKRAGCRFLGWFTAKSGGKQIAATTKFSSDRTVYAHWQALRTVAFDPNGGKCATKSKLVAKGAAIGTLPSATRSGCRLLGWYTAKKGGNKVSEKTKIDKNRTLYAHWQAVRTVTFDANGGTCATKTRTVAKGAAVGTLPGATRAGFRLEGWYTAKSGGSKVAATTKITKNRTLYARWQAVCTVTFDADGGTCATKSKVVAKGAAIGTLPEAAREGFRFLGWFPSKTGGSRIDATFLVTGDRTLFARWEEIVPEEPAGPELDRTRGRGGRAAESLDFAIEAEAGKTYELQWCGSLGPGAVWTTVLSVTAEEDGPLAFEAPIPAGGGQGFYRVLGTD